MDWEALNYCFQRRASYLRVVASSEPGSPEHGRAQRGVATFDRYIRMNVGDHPAYVEMLTDEDGTARLGALALSEAKAKASRR